MHYKHEGTFVSIANTISTKAVVGAIKVIHALPERVEGVTIAVDGDTLTIAGRDAWGSSVTVLTALPQDETKSPRERIAPVWVVDNQIRTIVETSSSRSDRSALTYSDGFLRFGSQFKVRANKHNSSDEKLLNTQPTAAVSPTALKQALAVLAPHAATTGSKPAVNVRIGTAADGSISVAVAGDYSAGTVTLNAIGGTSRRAAIGYTGIGVLATSAKLLKSSADQWTLTAAVTDSTCQTEISDGTTTVIHNAQTAGMPDFDDALAEPDGLRCWDLDIADLSDFDRFLSVLPRVFSADGAFIQIRNTGQSHGAKHPIELVARSGSNLAVAGDLLRGQSIPIVNTTSVDDVEVDVALPQMRQIVTSAMNAGGGTVTLRGYSPYETMGKLFLRGKNVTAVTISRIPQPL